MGWLRALFQKRVLDEQLDKELQFHVDELTRDNITAGMGPDEARRKALIVFGGTEQIKEKCRDARGINWIESVLQDVRYGVRTLRKDFRYTLTAIAALAIGISAFYKNAKRGKYDFLEPRPTMKPKRYSGVLVARYLKGEPVYVPTFGRRRAS